MLLAALLMAASEPASPVIIAHRGASGYRPEHTIAAYRLAIDQGADFIEPDLVMTRDGVLVARHENEISGTTDVADHPEFTPRWTSKMIDGTAVTGWFTEDFTLAELKTLRARERLPELRSANLAWRDETIPTMDEIVALAKGAGRRVGVYPEIKHPSYFASIGLAMEAPLVTLLTHAGYVDRDDAAFIQSFEVNNLKALRGMTKLRLVQLIDAQGGPADHAVDSYAKMITPAGLAAVANYADAIGPAKALIVPRDADDASLTPTTLVADAHAAGLLVHLWTFRSENAFLPAELRSGADPAEHGDAAAEYEQFFALGVDGLFSEFPDEAAAVRGGDASRLAADRSR